MTDPNQSPMSFADDSDDSGVTIQKVDGRTRQGRAMAAQRVRATREEPAERQSVNRNADGRVEVRGRDGEVLSRTRATGGDKFHIPAGMEPPGYKYQWNTVSVINNSDVARSLDLAMHANGWRPVPANRHPGMFMAHGATGAIIVDGMRLDERPIELCQEAAAEDLRNAQQLISDRNQSLKLQGVKAALPEGFEMSKRYRNSGGDVRLSIDRALDIPSPQHQLAGAED